MTMLHKHTGQCGYDRNASHSAGHYVCACGFEDETCVRSETGATLQTPPSGSYPAQGTQIGAAAHPLPTPRRFQPTTVGNMAVDKNGGYVSVDDYDLLEREAAELRAQLAEVKEALAGDDYASLPSDYPLVRMAHTIRADHDKFRNQVIDTCTRAETAERQRDEARKGEERYQWVLPILTGEGHEGDKRALAIAAQLVNGLTGSAAIDAAKEKSNG